MAKGHHQGGQVGHAGRGRRSGRRATGAVSAAAVFLVGGLAPFASAPPSAHAEVDGIADGIVDAIASPPNPADGLSLNALGTDLDTLLSGLGNTASTDPLADSGLNALLASIYTALQSLGGQFWTTNPLGVAIDKALNTIFGQFPIGNDGTCPSPGCFDYTFDNQTGLPNNDIYVTLYGMDPKGQWMWVGPHGGEHVETASKHDADLGSFKLSDASKFVMPANMNSGRMYISEGKPIVLPVSVTTDPTTGKQVVGIVGPDLNNPSNVNNNTPFDWFEFAYGSGVDDKGNPIQINFNGNTTQVDMFGIPYTYHLTQNAGEYIDPNTGHSVQYGASNFTEGVTKPFSQVAQEYHGAMNTPKLQPWESLIQKSNGQPLRLESPADWLANPPHADANPALNNWLNPEIDGFWTKYASNGSFEFNQTQGAPYTVQGQTEGNEFVYTLTPKGDHSVEFIMAKPSTEQAFASNGPFVELNPKPNSALDDTIISDDMAFLAQLGAAFNRGVALSPNYWSDAGVYYQNDINIPGSTAEPFNEWAWFFHQTPQISVDGRAYGFSYDDVNDQSTNRALPDPNPPTSLTFTLYPQK